MALLDDCVAYWRLNEASGNRADSVGSNTLSPVSTTVNATGKVGDGVLIDRDASRYLSRVDTADLSMGSGIHFTLAFWIKPTTVDTLAFLVNKSAGTLTSQYEYYIRINGADIQFNVSNGSTSGSVSAGITLSASTWYFVVCIYDGTNLIIVVNDGTPATTAYSSDSHDGTRDFIVGSSSVSTGLFNGVIDELVVWKRGIMGTEITEIFNSGNGLAFYPGAEAPASSGNFFFSMV